MLVKYLPIILLISASAYSMQLPDTYDQDFNRAMQMSLQNVQEEADLAQALLLSALDTKEEKPVLVDQMPDIDDFVNIEENIDVEEMELLAALIASMETPAAMENRTTNRTIASNQLPKPAVKQECPICAEDRERDLLDKTVCCKQIICKACIKAMEQKLKDEKDTLLDADAANQFWADNGHIPRASAALECPYCKKALKVVNT